jgi:hypothetical protein
MFERWRNFPTALKLQNNVSDITKFVLYTLNSDIKLGEQVYKTRTPQELKTAEGIVQKSIDLYNSTIR